MMKNQDILNSLREIVRTTTGAEPLLAEAVQLLWRVRPHFHWVGIYLLEGQDLVLGPYVGRPTQHTRIPLNRGICGAAASMGQTIVVDDVNSDPRYLACSLETRSEIVVPLKRGQRVLGEIDIDSDQPRAFTDNDRQLLEDVAAIVAAEL